MKLYLTTSLLFLFLSIGFSQTVKINGVVLGEDDLDGIHVINNDSKSYTITNVAGEFKVNAKLNDTLVFSSILYQLKKVVVTERVIKSKYISVGLQMFTNQLNEVTLGKVLTGNLMSDIKNLGKEKQITFKDVGIPGYTGKPLTQNQNRLYEASSLKPTIGGGLGGAGVGLQLNPLINAITGRTSMLKERVSIEQKTDVLRRIKNKFSESFFDQNELPEDKREEFFMFCKEHPQFLKYCSSNDLVAFQFLQKQYKVYLQRIANSK